MAHDVNAPVRPAVEPTAAPEPARPFFVIGRDLRPAGRLFRLGFVLIAIASLSARIADQLDGAGLAAMALYTAAIFAAYTGLFAALRRVGAFERLSPWTTAAILQAPMLLYPLQVGSPAFHNGLAVFTTLSALLCPLMGYGGLEVASFPALVFKRRPVLYSPFNTIDVIERAFAGRVGARRGILWGVSLAVAAILIVDDWYAPLLLTVPWIDRNVDHGIALSTGWAALLLLPVGYFLVRAWRTRAQRRHSPAAGLYLLAAGCTALLMLMFLGDQVPDHTLWGLILAAGLVAGVVQLFRRRPAR